MAHSLASPAAVTADTLAAFSDAFNRHDTNALMGFMTDDCVFCLLYTSDAADDDSLV